jgi:guanosine-3',5'-bis(diphosphate) 3'-pyrophosphohydrolase
MIFSPLFEERLRMSKTVNNMGLVLKACEFASRKHSNQRRKNAGADPYINHPIEVANILAESGVTDQDVLCAALLHDTVEDTDTTIEELARVFGSRIASIVSECTDDRSLSKLKRKKMQIEHALVISEEAKLVKLADKISNLKSIETDPPKKWSKEQIDGYIDWCLAVCRNIIGTMKYNTHLHDLIKKIFKDRMTLPEQELDERLQGYYKLL